MAQFLLQAAVQTVQAGIVALVSRQISNLFAEDQQGPRLEGLQLQTSTAGAPVPRVYGRMRLAGQVIWAARFTEIAEDESVGGKGGGPTVTNYSYSASFAVGLTEGEIGRIGRIWANGEELDTSNLIWRWYPGTSMQSPDPLIEAVEGAGMAPAYRGLAYVVFEDMPLEIFGNRLPNLSFEVMSAPGEDSTMEQDIKGVCLIPSSGEFIYSDTPVVRNAGFGEERPENVHTRRASTDLDASLDDLAAALPNCQSIALVTAWFGNDLRCGECEIRPGVEIRNKQTRPLEWSAAGETRATAWLVSEVEGAPAYGGTPSDQSIIQAIQALKSRGYEVTLYPFILLDIPTGNALPDPYGGAEQSAYPWRGRITCYPAPGEAGSPDKTGAATSQIDDFFGNANASDFNVTGETITYSGPAEWRFHRFILHHAALAKAADGVEAFLIGSEMRSLTTVRDSATHYPAVDQLILSAGEVRTLLGASTQLSYAADWSEYFGHQPADGSGDRLFHLDDLWASADIDFIGIDWYAPLSDWRNGTAHLDANGGQVSLNHQAYLQSNIEGGEGYDWYYASQSDRDQQVRTAITDGTYGEPWVFRYKDIRNWWASSHHDRVGGVRQPGSTAWVPESKPIRLVEYGCPAIDKATNQPNVFVDAKSSESAVPHYSNRTRDDLIQRRAIEALTGYWQANNPISSVYAGPMIDLDHSQVWTWDARPFPEFPSLSSVWADAENWRLGHWLSGRAGQSSLARIVSDIAALAGLPTLDVTRLQGVVTGFVMDRPRAARDVLSDLAGLFGFDIVDQSTGPVCLPRQILQTTSLNASDLIRLDENSVLSFSRLPSETLPTHVRVGFFEDGPTYDPATAYAQGLDTPGQFALDLRAGWVSDEATASGLAGLVLNDIRSASETASLVLPPSLSCLEPGDGVVLDEGRDGIVWCLDASDGLTYRDSQLTSILNRDPLFSGSQPVTSDPDPVLPAQPLMRVLDLPLSPAEGDVRGGLILAAHAVPWPGDLIIYAGSDSNSLTQRVVLSQASRMGELLSPLGSGPEGRWDRASEVHLRLYAGNLSNADRVSVLSGLNRLAIQSSTGWEVLQFQTAELVGSDEWRLTNLLRGQGGSTINSAPVASSVVFLSSSMTILPLGENERDVPVTIRVVPSGRPLDDISVHELTVTYEGVDQRPLSPVHLQEVVGSSSRSFSWIRRTRQGGDAWTSGSVPLKETSQAYQFEILDADDTIVHSEILSEAGNFLTDSEISSLLPGGVSGTSWRVAQISETYGAGQYSTCPLQS